jgi:hypothetical protein
MYALIKNNLVENVILADQAFADSIAPGWDAVVPSQNAGIGWTYVDGVFTAPPAPTPTPAQPIRTLTKLQYMGRFTDAELVGIYTAAKTVVQVEIWLEKFKLASEINLDDPATVSGLQAMESAGLIGVGRAAEILA